MCKSRLTKNIRLYLSVCCIFLALACERRAFMVISDDYAADSLVNQSFTLKQSSNRNAEIDFSTGESTSSITIKAVPRDEKTKQGQLGNAQEKRATQTGIDEQQRTDTVQAKIDIGIVIDDSPSLKDNERAGIAKALSGKLASTLKDSHWRVHITGTSRGGPIRVTGGLVTYSDRGNKADKMEKAMIRTKNVRGKKFYNEVALYKARRIESLFRNDSDVVKAFIIVSDEDMQCYTGGEFTHSCQQVSNRFKSDFVNNRSAVYGIISPALDWGRVATCGFVNAANNKGCRAEAGKCGHTETGYVRKNARGCNNDKNEKYNLKEGTGFCGERPTKGGHLNACFDRPDDWKNAVQAWINSGLFAVTAKIGGNYDTIFTRIADDVKSKVVDITIPGKPWLKHIDLDHNASAIVTNTLQVRANGRPIPDSGYSISGNRLTLKGDDDEISKIWPTGTELVVSYKLAIHNKMFPVPRARADEVLIRNSVRVNGSSNSFTLTQDGRQVELSTAPAPGTTVTVAASFMKTVYPFELVDHPAQDWTPVCAIGNRNIDCHLANSRVRFTRPEQINVGDKVEITQREDLAKAGIRMKVDKNYVDSSLVIRIGSESCDASKFKVVDFKVDAEDSSNQASCPMLSSLMQDLSQMVYLDYKIYDPQTTFKVKVPLFVGKDWTPDVKVNGKTLVFEQDYVLDENESTITFVNLDAFAVDSKVVVSFLPKTTATTE